MTRTWLKLIYTAAEHFFSSIGKHQPGCAIPGLIEEAPSAAVNTCRSRASKPAERQ
jgi:hypothetical protein